MEFRDLFESKFVSDFGKIQPLLQNRFKDVNFEVTKRTGDQGKTIVISWDHGTNPARILPNNANIIETLGNAGIRPARFEVHSNLTRLRLEYKKE